MVSLYYQKMYIFELVKESASFQILKHTDEFLLGDEQTFQIDNIPILETFQDLRLIDKTFLNNSQKKYILFILSSFEWDDLGSKFLFIMFPFN